MEKKKVMSFVVFSLLFLLCQMEMQKKCGVAEHNMHAAPCGLRCWHHWALSKLSQLICRILTTAGKAITGAKHLHMLASLPNLALMNAFSSHFTAFRACCLCASHSCSCLLCGISSLAKDARTLTKPVWREPPCTLHVLWWKALSSCRAGDGNFCTSCCMHFWRKVCNFMLQAFPTESNAAACCSEHFWWKVLRLSVVASISDGMSWKPFLFARTAIWGPQLFVKPDLHTERICNHSVEYCRRSCWQLQAILHTCAWQWAGSHNMLLQ